MPYKNVLSFYKKELKKVQPGTKSAKACCPFHDDNNPSFSFYLDNGRFKCFGCGEEGSIIDFVMKTRKWSFTKAVRYLEKEGIKE